MVLLSLDIKNGYNTIADFFWSSGRTSPLLITESTLQMSQRAASKVTRSPPCAFLSVWVGLQDALHQVQTVIAELVDSEETIGCSKLGGVYSFVDDTNTFWQSAGSSRLADLFYRRRSASFWLKPPRSFQTKAWRETASSEWATSSGQSTAGL